APTAGIAAATAGFAASQPGLIAAGGGLLVFAASTAAASLSARPLRLLLHPEPGSAMAPRPARRCSSSQASD
ncbi:MAG: hypothetical protein ACRDRJ_45355, partial [Streptosporangiaceae bacterium]